MQVSPTGIELIKHFEGLRLESYQDVADIWTIGYGHTGPEVATDQAITEAEAEALLRQDLSRFEQGVSAAVKVDIDQNQFDALVSLTYNIGLNAFKGSTALRRLNKRDYLGTAEAMTWWNKATINGVKREVLGLVRRRAAEAALFLEDVTATGDSNAEDDSTRVQPEENSPRRGNVLGSRTMEGATAAGAGGVAGAGATMIDTDDEPSETPTTTESSTDENPNSEQPDQTPDNPTIEQNPDATSPDSSADTTQTSTEQPTQDQGQFSRNDYIDAFQIGAGVVVVLAVLYIIFARIDDWLNYRR